MKKVTHFKIVPLEYSCPGVYFQTCIIATKNPTLLATSSFFFKVGMSKISEFDLDL